MSSLCWRRKRNSSLLTLTQEEVGISTSRDIEAGLVSLPGAAEACLGEDLAYLGSTLTYFFHRSLQD